VCENDDAVGLTVD